MPTLTYYADFADRNADTLVRVPTANNPMFRERFTLGCKYVVGVAD